ncbi:MAG: hypothetical protein HYS89_01035 [Candidatus Colwellbacteria bacterium]|nr:hypothetical protein [Candidatus Colwellbacteria bacterium]
MIKKNFEQIIKEAKSVGLSKADKAELKRGLVNFIKTHPVRAEVVVRQQVLDGEKESILRIPWLLNRLKPMPIVLVIVLLLSGGTAMAAGGSLPGDALYPVKVEVNERVQGWLTFDTAAKADLNVRLAERRLEEAEKLAARGRLDAETQAEIEVRLNERAERARVLASRFADAGNLEISLNISSGLEAMFRAHELVLRGLLIVKPEAETSINAMLQGVKANTASSMEARSETEANLAANANADFEAAARGKMTAAENKIEEVEAFFDKKKESTDAELVAEAEVRLRAAETAFAEGKEKLAAEGYAEAFILFNQALWLAEEAQLTLAAEGNLGIKLDLPRAELRIGGQGSVNSDADEDKEENQNETEMDSEGSLEINLGY